MVSDNQRVSCWFLVCGWFRTIVYNDGFGCVRKRMWLTVQKERYSYSGKSMVMYDCY